MDEFANLPTKEKQPYFDVAASSKGLRAELIEKDFWVSWLLSKLFTTDNIKDELLFKGGTSLSKVYKVIDRFSEDIDITISREYFGFVNDKSPEFATSNKQRDKLLSKLSQVCGEFVQSELKSILEGYVSSVLPNVKDHISIEPDPEDKAKQTLLFYYPTEASLPKGQYIQPIVKIELGARGGNWPILDKQILPMVEEERSGAIAKPNINIKALDVKRTFWEKAVILHKYSHFPEDKTIPERQSRHYFDFYKLIESNTCSDAQNDTELLQKVVEHNKVYFRTGWANYNTATKGNLNLVSNARVLGEMAKDYVKMQDMIYSSEIEWDEIIRGIDAFGKIFNNS